MKKLIAILLPLLLSATALAEETIGAADGPTSIFVAEQSLLSKGLIVTAGGLCGVFLVLILFFFTIKIMQKILK
ncbi:MAG: hypothetical protein IJX84_02625 [Clostridia bacterium]|nr:hypothetical protein [Clostridia bacterium]